MTVNNPGGGSGSGGGGNPTVAYDTPEAHGAKRDGATDDTAAIQAAVNNAVAMGIANGSNYAEVIFSAGIYQLLSPPAGHGSPNFANSQIVLPFVQSGNNPDKFTLRLRGPGDAGSALPHWNQWNGHKGGAVLRSRFNGTNDVTWGPASILGGPTTVQGYGGGTGNAWSNMLVIVDGLQIGWYASNPAMAGFNFEGLLEAKIISGSYIITDDPPVTMANPINVPANFTNQWTFGLKMPATNNNDLAIIDDWSCEGAWYGVILAEHSHVRDLRSIYCGWGIALDASVSTPHIAHIDYASVEICQNVMGLANGTALFKIDIDLLDMESANYIWDGNNNIQGTIVIGANATPTKGVYSGPGYKGSFVGNWNASPGTVGQQMRLINRDVLPGGVTTNPGIVAASTDFYNGFCRDAAVTITGGTSVAISVDGVALGVGSPTTVMVPEGKRINLGAYTGTPAWKWTLL